MALRLLILLMVAFLFCIALASSDDKINEDQQSQAATMTYHLLNFHHINSACFFNLFSEGGGLCNVRCSLHSRPKVCSRACGTSCARCKCVPPGLLQATDACGRCYTDMPTHRNKPKCP
ncbi:hypothetical protein I3843_05G134900 [Carya illinoinensis]|nr:hypothetical protein I3843_05G134900 [Carya illinoinensis]